MRRALLAPALLIATLAIACQMLPAARGPQETSTPDPAASEKARTPEPTITSMASTPEPAVPEEARRLVDLAKADLSRRKSASLEQIKVVSVEETTWLNGSLGFPKPGMVYIQVIIPGYRIIMSDGAQTYEYHTDMSQRIEYGE